MISALKDIDEPKLLHIRTTKGKGYPFAEHNQALWHAPGRFNPETGERLPSKDSAARYQDVFGKTLLELAARAPSTSAALQSVSGVGERKAAAYGPAFLEEIRSFLRQRGEL